MPIGFSFESMHLLYIFCTDFVLQREWRKIFHWRCLKFWLGHGVPSRNFFVPAEKRVDCIKSFYFYGQLFRAEKMPEKDNPNDPNRASLENVSFD